MIGPQRTARNFAAFAALLVIGAAAPYAHAQVWQASADYSSTQGYKNWRYMTFRTSDSTYGQMVFGSENYFSPYFGFPVWYGVNELGYDTGSTIFPSWQHPSEAGYEAARVWESPIAGTVRVTGTVAEIDDSPRNPAFAADGVQATIWKNGELLFSADIEDSDLVGYSYDLSVHMLPGDWLVFRVQARSTAAYDATYFDPRITVQSLDGPPGGSWIADVLSEFSAYVAGLDLSLFAGQNNHARSGRRLTLSHELQVASNRVSSGETTAAINLLLNVRMWLYGYPFMPDWMVESSQKTALHDDLGVLIDLLSSP